MIPFVIMAALPDRQEPVNFLFSSHAASVETVPERFAEWAADYLREYYRITEDSMSGCCIDDDDYAPMNYFIPSLSAKRSQRQTQTTVYCCYFVPDSASWMTIQLKDVWERIPMKRGK
jgi:hypothetical protein